MVVPKGIEKNPQNISISTDALLKF
jgi:hypothetical protein